jgi:alkylated DNA repair dioxygenase AlkB
MKDSMFPADLLNGLELKENFITSVEEAKLLIEIDSRTWLNDLKRRVQHYGYKYDYKARGNLEYLGEIPEFLKEIDVGFKFNQVIVNEYLPGQGISPHIDLPSVFGGCIASLSLGSSCVMEFTKGSTKIPLLLPQRSLLILTDEARYQWKHAIPTRKQDNGIARTRRVSITFRMVLL